MATQENGPTAAEADRSLKAAHRAMWALGNYHRFATSTVWELGPVLVQACGIAAGQRVLDVAAGTGTRPSGRRGRGPGWWRRTSRPSTSKRDAARRGRRE